ncbi:MAG TPA: murein biosynthesis integral membrane protein MurJ [Actinomycetota bacterium]|nr:murein biosynthesis integral membrane protein MurJ [Actinomycetota bacterium]
MSPGSSEPPPPEDSTRSFVRNTVVMSTGTALSRLTGFLRLSAMAFALGITESRLADAYNIANVTPNILYELALGGILTSVVVPVVVEWMQTRGRDVAWDVVRRLFTLAFVVLSGIAVAGILLAPWIVDLYTTGVPESQQPAVRDLATFYLRWFMPQIVFYGLGAVATGLLNAHRRFAPPMFAPILNNLVVIATFLLFYAMRPESGSHEVATDAQRLVLAIGTTLGVVAMTVVLWPFVRGTGFRFRWLAVRGDPAIRTMLRLATWVIVYVGANQLGYLVVMILAGEQQGGYTAYAAAFILFQLPHAIFAVSIFTALLPAMSSRWTARDLAGFRDLLSQGIRATAVILIPATLGYLVLARDIVRLLLEHGAADTPESGDLVAEVLVFFAIGLFAFSAFQLLLRASYSMQDTRTPALVNLAAVALNVLVNLVFFFVLDLGVPGLALGHATSYVFASIVLLLVVRARIGGLDGRRIVRSLGRVVVAGVATAAAAWLVARGIERWLGTATIGTQAVQVLTAVTVGLVVFVASAAALRIEEVTMVRRQVTARWRG